MLHDGYMLAALGCLIVGLGAVAVVFWLEIRDEHRRRQDFNRLWGGVR